MFFIIIGSLVRNNLCSKTISKKGKNNSFFYQQLIIAITLSVLFGLGWGVGLFATQDIHTNKTVQDILAALFVVFTTFHGLAIFIMHCFRSKEVRNTWKRCFCNVTAKDNSQFIESALSRKYQQKGPTIEPDNFGDHESHRFCVKKSAILSMNDALIIENKSVEFAETALS